MICVRRSDLGDHLYQPSLTGVRAAALAGLAITPLPASALIAGLRILGVEEGLPRLEILRGGTHDRVGSNCEGKRVEVVGYMRTSSATNVGDGRDSEPRQRKAIEGYSPRWTSPEQSRLFGIECVLSVTSDSIERRCLTTGLYCPSICCIWSAQ